MFCRKRNMNFGLDFISESRKWEFELASKDFFKRFLSKIIIFTLGTEFAKFASIRKIFKP